MNFFDTPGFFDAPTIDPICLFNLISKRHYDEFYLRYLQAQRDFPNLNHIGHEPSTERLPVFYALLDLQDRQKQLTDDFHRH